MSKKFIFTEKAFGPERTMSQAQAIDWNRIFNLNSILFMLAGVLCAVVALKGYMLPNQFIDGGVVGVSIILSKKLPVNISIFLLVLNLPFIYIGYKKIGRNFAIQTSLAIVLLAVLINVIPIQPITDTKILAAFFGGFFIGLGIGLAIKSGGVLDGLEVIADYTHKKSGFSTSEIVMIFNTVLILAAAIFFGPEPAMYSIITYFTAMKTSDYIVDGFEEYTALTVISGKHDLIKSIIVNDFQKAISVFKGERGYLPGSFDIKADCDIIMTIVTRLEIHRLKMAVLEADPHAFVYIQSIKEVKGGIIKPKIKH